MVELLEFARFYHTSEWFFLLAVIVSILLLNKVCGLNAINALISAQIMLVFNAIPIIAGMVDNYLPVSRVWFFFLTEAIFMIAVCWVYRGVLKLGRNNMEIISNAFGGITPYVLILVSFSIAAFAFVFQPDEGTSRIMYQTNYWYSLLKPFIALFTPLSFLAVFVILQVERRRVPAYTLLLANVLGGVASGSKGAFVIQAVSGLLIVRDIGLGRTFQLQKMDVAVAALGLTSGVVVSLQRLQLVVGDLWDRVMLFGEPTLLVYFAPDPTVACRNLSLIARMHRGWARMLGDPGALNIDTLFGYAWTMQYTGVNTFTGPNARYSAYMICNFPGWDIAFGVLMSALYLFLIGFAIRIATRQSRMVPIVYAFVVFSLMNAAQDFNVIMQDINFLLFISTMLIIFPRRNDGPQKFLVIGGGARSL